MTPERLEALEAVAKAARTELLCHVGENYPALNGLCDAIRALDALPSEPEHVCESPTCKRRGRDLADRLEAAIRAAGAREPAIASIGIDAAIRAMRDELEHG